MSMKRLRKLVLSIALCLFVVTVPVIAAVTKPEITIRTDKKEYSGDDKITAVIDVNNVTGKDIKNIVLSGAVPAGYETEDGVSAPDTWEAELDEVTAGSTGSVTVTFSKKNETIEDSSTEDSSTDDSSTEELTTTEAEYEVSIVPDQDSADAKIFISMGKIDDPTPASTITIKDVKLVEVDE